MNFGKIPVEFVPPGMTAEEARRRRKRQMGPSQKDIFMAIGSVVLLLLLCGGSGWYYVGRGRAEEAATAEIANIEPSPQAAPGTVGPLSPSPAPPQSESPSTPLPPPVPVVLSVAVSPLATPSPFPLLGYITPTNTAPPIVEIAAVNPIPTDAPAPSPTPTASPYPYDYDYEVIGNEVQPSDLYAYVSGWIVEQDGSTPRPARVRLRFATGEMLYPRPNNRDMANGRYEFMVSPGRYWLEVDDQSSPVIQIDVGDAPARYEVSFRSLHAEPLAAPARSSPWDEPDHAASAPARPAVITPAINYHHHLFLPAIIRYDDEIKLRNSYAPMYRLYFPLIIR